MGGCAAKRHAAPHVRRVHADAAVPANTADADADAGSQAAKPGITVPGSPGTGGLRSVCGPENCFGEAQAGWARPCTPLSQVWAECDMHGGRV